MAVAAAMNEESRTRAAALAEQGAGPKLAIIRCGEGEDDISYEKSAQRAAETAGVALECFVLPSSVRRQELFDLIHQINTDSSIHGCLILRPLPGELAAVQQEICACLAPEKDVDCCTPAANAALFCWGYSYIFRIAQDLLTSGKITTLFNEKVMTGILVFTKYNYPANLFASIMLGREIGKNVGILLAIIAVALALCRSEGRR